MQAHFIPSGTRLGQLCQDSCFLHDTNIIAKQGMDRSPRTLTLRQVRAVCTQREPTGRVIIVIVAEREDEREEREERRDEKRREEKRREEKRREEKRRQDKRREEKRREEKREKCLFESCSVSVSGTSPRCVWYAEAFNTTSVVVVRGKTSRVPFLSVFFCTAAWGRPRRYMNSACRSSSESCSCESLTAAPTFC